MADGAKKLIDFNDHIGGEEALQIAARALRSLKKDVTELSKTVADDGGRITAGFAAIKAGIADIQGKVKLTLIDPADLKVIAAFQKQIDELKRKEQEYQATKAAQITIQRGLTETTKQYTSELAKQKDALRAAALAGDAEGQKKAAAAIRQTTLETTQLSKALRGANSEFTAAKGSYDALVIENNKLLASLRGLEGGLMSGSQEALKLKKQIYDNTQTLKDFDQATNISFRNVGNYAQSFSGLIAELAKARTAQSGFAEGSAEAARQQMRIAGFQTAAQRAAAQAGLSYEQAEAKIAGVTAAVQPLTTALVRLEKEQLDLAKTTGEDTEAFRKIGFQIQQTKTEIEKVAEATVKAGEAQEGLGKQLGFTKEGFSQYIAQLAVGAIGLQAIAQAAVSVFQSNVEYSRNLAEVRKTTGLTADEAERLAQSLKGLDSPTNLAGLLKIASVGGQLGIAKNDLLDFTKAIDTAVQALGNDFSGGAEEIATTLGKISSVFGKQIGNDPAQNILAIGSAVNELGAVGAATAPFLTDVALRVGAIASQAGIGLKDVLAYGAVLQETGFSAEVSGTALNRFFSTLSTKTKESFEIAKNANPALTLKEFTRLVNTDFNAAAQLFLKGLNAGGKTTTALNKELATLKLQSGEAKNAIITLAQNTELFAERQKTANDQLRDATSLTKEAAVNSDTLGSSVDKLKNNTSELVTGGALGGFLKFLVDFVAFDFKLLSAGLKGIGDGIAYVGEKIGLVKDAKPLQDYAAAITTTALAARKQADAQQQLLDSYQKLAGQATRTGAEERQLSELRAKLGSGDVAAVQKEIDARRGQFEGIKAQFHRDIDGLNADIDNTNTRVARAQDALLLQSSTLTAAQLAQVKQIAQARLESNNPIQGKSSVPELENAISAQTRLLKATGDLTEKERNRANLIAGLAKLEGANTQAKKDGADAADAGAAAEERLGRTAVEAAKNRLQALKAALSENQFDIDLAKKYQAEQGKLFEDKQLTTQVFAESVAGSQDFITQKERDGTALRIQIARAESAEKLAEAQKDREGQLARKKLSEAEKTDIEGQFSKRRIGIAEAELAEITKINREAGPRQGAVEQAEFKIAGLDPVAVAKAEDEITNFLSKQEQAYQRQLKGLEGNARNEMTLLAQQFAAGTISRQQYEDGLFEIRKKAVGDALKLRDKFHRDENQQDADQAAIQIEAAQRLAAKIQRVAEATSATLLTIDGYYNQYRQNELDTRTANVEQQYKNEVAAAGENKALLTEIEKKHDKEVRKLAREQAVLNRNAAAFEVAIQTAVAVAKAFAASPATFGLPFSAIALANGLVQEALIFSKPLPAYRLGRKGGPAELAEVGEAGAELIHRKTTNRFEYIAQRSVVQLDAHDRVIPAAETTAMLAAVGLNHQQAQQPTQVAAAFGGAAQGAAVAREAAAGRGYDKMAENLAANTAALKKIQAPKITVHRGSDADVETSNQLTHYLGQRRFEKRG